MSERLLRRMLERELAEVKIENAKAFGETIPAICEQRDQAERERDELREDLGHIAEIAEHVRNFRDHVGYGFKVNQLLEVIVAVLAKHKNTGESSPQEPGTAKGG